MVTVVAIMGVMAAVAVPMVNNQLGKTREKSYAQDRAMIQTAVDSYFTAADNIRYLGQRQFPLMGNTKTTGTPDKWTQTIQVDGNGDPVLDSNSQQQVTGAQTMDNLIVDFNPVRGTRGGEPKWRDGNGDGNRTLGGDGQPVLTNAGEDRLNGELETLDPARTNSSISALSSDGSSANAISGGSSGWYVDKVKFQAVDHAVDSRDYFIDFTLLVKAGLLQAVPESASPDNGGVSISGSYSWYVRDSGAAQSLLYFLPSNGDSFRVIDATTGQVTNSEDGSVDSRGYQDGVYP